MVLPRITQPAPFFKGQAVMPDKQFKEISLDDYRGKWLVLFFYPLDFTFVCPTEILAYSEAATEFKRINTEVLAASCDSKFSHLAWTNQDRKKGGLGEMHIPMLSDETKSISRSYGVLIDQGEDAGLPLRGLFIIDPLGILRQVTVNDLPIGRSVEETIRLVNAFQFADEHGEVCPVNWKKGDKAIKVPNALKTYEEVQKDKLKEEKRLVGTSGEVMHLIKMPYQILNYAISGSIEAIVGDIIGSIFFNRRRPAAVTLERIVKVGLYGGLIRGPILWIWHNILRDYIGYLMKGLNQTSKDVILFLVDRILFAPPFVFATVWLTQLIESGIAVDENTSRLYAFALMTNQQIWAIGKIIMYQLNRESKVVLYHVLSIVWHIYLASL